MSLCGWPHVSVHLYVSFPAWNVVSVLSLCLLPPLQSLIVRSQLDLWPFSLAASFVSSLPGSASLPSTYYYQVCSSCTQCILLLYVCAAGVQLSSTEEEIFVCFVHWYSPSVWNWVWQTTQKILFSDCGSEELISQDMATVNLKSSFLVTTLTLTFGNQTSYAFYLQFRGNINDSVNV